MKFVPRSEDTRQFIIEKTAAVFNKKGYAGTSMSDITAATNLTKGSIYGNFENKDAVALAVFDYNASRKNKVVAEKIAATSGFREKLLVYALVFCIKETSVFADGGCPLLNTGTEADDTHEPLRKKVGDELLAWKKNLTTTLQAGIKAGEFNKATNIERFSASVMALVEGGIFVARSTKSKKHLDLALETVKEMIDSISLEKN